MKKLMVGISLIIGIIILIYLLGPRPHYLSFDGVPQTQLYEINEVEELIRQDNIDPRIMPRTHARIVWADSARITDYSIVYFHGFSATHPEGYPVHENLAKQFGCNLFLTRFPDHGLIDSNSYKTLEPKQWIDYGKQAIAIGKTIGKKVIIMSTSTGGTVSIYLTAHDPEIAGQILLSPNIDLYDTNSNLLNDPWGYQLGKLVFGGEYRHFDGPDSVKKYWTMNYHIQGLVALRELIDKTMTKENFRKISSPVFLGYFYKNEQEQDHVVSIPAMHSFLDDLSIDQHEITEKPFPNAKNHVIGSIYWNPNYTNVEKAIATFMEETLSLTKRNVKIYE